MKRDRLVVALAKPLPDSGGQVHTEVFDPWHDVLSGIDGSYASNSDVLMIEALEAVRDRATFDFIDRRGFLGEFALYVLSGHGLTEYGTSPRGGWPNPSISDLWDDLIGKWIGYAVSQWGEDFREDLNGRELR